MRKANVDPYSTKMIVDIKGLQNLLSLGSYNANQIGEKAGAVIRFGRRKMYIVSKINDYINQLSTADQKEGDR